MAGRKVHHLFACGDFQFDLWIGLAERGDHRLQYQRDDRSGNGEAQEPGGALPQITRGLAGGDELLEGGLRARNESFAGFGQTDTARCADKQRCADSRL